MIQPNPEIEKFIGILRGVIAKSESTDEIIFTSYVYNPSAVGDPYRKSYSCRCKNLEEAAEEVIKDFEGFNKYTDYGGADVTVNGTVIFESFPNGNTDCRDDEFEKLIERRN